MVPYLVSFYDGKLAKSFFNNDPDKLVKDFIDNLFIKKYNNKLVYMHNFTGFDGFFLIRYLVNLTSIKPLIHNGEFISIECIKDGIKLIFRDSYKHLLASLDKLSKSFGVENKGIFPYYFTDLDYKGEFPNYKYFDPNKVSIEEYNKALEESGNKTSTGGWNFEKEAIKYCEQDCRSLHQVISKYNELFFSNFNFNIHKYPTLPSLAFANYRTNFMPSENFYPIPQINDKIYKDIKLSYTGGATEMYIPVVPQGVKIHAYDINSLYPSVMLNNDFPIGNPTYFEGNILKISPKAFGFFYCKITAPKDLKHPILQIHYKTKNGIRTLSPLGEFEGVFFSQELYNAEKFGYNFEILWGYTFKKANIFKEYITNLYQLRLEYPKTAPMNFIAKIHLNSLYGRFGMKDLFEDIVIFVCKAGKKMIINYMKIIILY